MKKNILIKSLLLLFIVCNLSCTEPYVLQSDVYQNSLVVEATLTNELKHHEVKLTRTSRLNESQPEIETGAFVRIIGDDGSSYNFEEIDNLYKSENEFQAQPGILYKLVIETSTGKTYSSNLEKLPSSSTLESVVPFVETNNDGIRGVAIKVNSYDPSATSNFYRYTYEETFKIVVPKWSNEKLTFTSNNDIIISLRDDPNTQVCYRTEKSNEILLTSTNNQTEDRVTNFPILFIPQQTTKIAHRYSINVTQYVENYNTYVFYNTLKNFSSSGNVLSQIQPGEVVGNIKCETNPGETVVGIFNVASVSTKRLFFNYVDLFPGEPLPEYYGRCEVQVYDKSCLSRIDPCAAFGYFNLKYAYEAGQIVYFNSEGDLFEMVDTFCGDCRVLGSNVIPPFWQ
ncbi:DUF4249 domain-containing protein [Flavobacterium proteolyticum]|uniref:DUF4249 domain-containing protein n=1 Tax=Flavobacterium proteolyticum TaxID=2911683 RepID=A0ABR9WN68_9FLAO|nr:DUF4249 domain-containing protein [Flavobacterium proteolyticum]MBE9575272.1 DUF4249 domain-containing protein [Flavobacterium proteolyticum]